MSSDERERDDIRRTDEYLTEHFGVVVDDVVLQAWGTGDPWQVYEHLAAAVADSGGTADPTELLPVAEHIALPDREIDSLSSQVHGDTSPGPRRSPMIDAARLLASELLTQLPDQGQRWQHTRAVAGRAAEAAHLFPPETADELIAAAWLHDIGYAPKLKRHGFHPVDGAEHVHEHLAAPTVAGLIAHHSGARFVADVRGLAHLLIPYSDPGYWSSPVADALTWADQTIGPDGQRTTVQDRLHEMLTRHGPDSPNARSNDRRAPAIIAAVQATESRLARARVARARATEEVSTARSNFPSANL